MRVNNRGLVKIILNNECKRVQDDIVLTELIAELALQGSRYAIEVNQKIIPKAEHQNFKLKPDDKIEIVRAIGGG